MVEHANPPFQSITFTLIAGTRPRASFRMTAGEDGLYSLHVERGSAANPTSQFTREVPLESAQRLKDALQEIGVFGWEESYGNAAAGEPMRWTLHTVFKEGVFSVSSKGGNDTPAGFDRMLEELYRLDFPRPEESRVGKRPSMGALGGFDAANGLAGVDFSQMADALSKGGMDGLDASEMSELLAEAQRDPQAIQRRMRDEFRHMPPDEQERMLDALASTGMASRAWWERFLRG